MLLPLLLDGAAIPEVSLLSLAGIGSIITLTLLETILGVDNVIFLSILVAKLPREQQTIGRRLGLVMALGTRVLLLLTLSWLTGLTKPLFEVLGRGISGRDLVLILGGGFLIFKSTWEIFSGLESHDPREKQAKDDGAKRRAFFSIVLQIAVMDVVFSLDSVITAVGLARQLPIILIAMTLSMIAMLGFAGWIGEFIERHPSMKVLALSFLILIGTLLVAEGGGQHLPKGYVYAAMAFSVTIELLNIWLRKRAEQVRALHGLTQHTHPLGSPEAISARIAELETLVEEQRRRIAELEAARG
ncbi:MAG: TerC family protein [Myxococcales bacterium]|nr:TerC family protein [Polyangiaceae bacterium]MDW8249086.1 TerC family protein [Myxococcales bacterium]